MQARKEEMEQIHYRTHRESNSKPKPPPLRPSAVDILYVSATQKHFVNQNKMQNPSSSTFFTLCLEKPSAVWVICRKTGQQSRVALQQLTAPIA